MATPKSAVFNLNVEKGRVNTNQIETWGQDANWLNMDTAMQQDIQSLFNQLVNLLYSVQDSVPVTGGTVTSNGSNLLAINPATALSTLTIVFPPSPVNGQIFIINLTQNITTATFSGGTIQHYSGPTALGAGALRYIYDTAQASWLLC